MATLQDIFAEFLKPSDAWQMRLIQNWPELVGELHQRMRLEKIERDQIVIGVYDHHWMHELFHMSPFIVHTLNRHLGGNYITHIRFILVTKKKRTEKIKNVPDVQRQERVPRPLSREQQQALGAITDDELKTALTVFLQKVAS